MVDSEVSPPDADISSLYGFLGAAALLLLAVGGIVLLAFFRFEVWILLIAIIPILFQGVIFAVHYTEGKGGSELTVWSYLPTIVVAVFFVFVAVSGIVPRAAGPAHESTASGAEAEEPSFEMVHGFGPIKEVVEVGSLDTAMALRGEQVFNTKCGTCHKLDERYTGPPLRYVTNYRSPTFIMNQILDPSQNVAKHPHMQELLKMYYTYMTNQNVSRDQARELVEYLRWEAGRQ